MKRKLLLLSLVLASAVTCFGQQISQDLHIVPPYNLCFGGYDGTAACFKKSATNTVDLTGTLTVNGSAVGGAGLTITTVSGLASVSGKTKGTIAVVTDGNSATDCATGTGSTVVTCQYSGSTWAAFGGGSGDATTVNGAAVPSSKTLVGTNSSGQVVDASSSSISNNTSGTAANLSGDGVIHSSPTCPSPNLGGCYFANWDAHYVKDVTTTNGSSTVTCPNNDCNFTSTDGYGRPIAKAGQIVFVTSDPLKGSTTCPQTTIATINSAQSITLTAANDCTASLTGTGALYWGDDDTTALNAAWAATNCGELVLSGPPPGDSAPGGYAMAMFQSAVFIASPSCVSPTNTFQGPSLSGAGITSTYLLATPNFNFATCTGGYGGAGAGIACTAGVINGHYRDFTIWGGGASPSGTAWYGKALFELAPATRAESVDVQGWGALVAGGAYPMAHALYGVFHNSENGVFYVGGAIYAGNVACASNAVQTIWQGNACEVINTGSNEAFALRVLAGSTAVGLANGYVHSGASGCAIDVIGTLEMFNELVLPPVGGISGMCIDTGGIVYTYGNTTIDVSAAISTALYFRGTTGKAYLSGTTLKSGASGQDIYMANAAHQVYDLGGNQFLGTTHVGNSGTGQVIGSLSRTGTLLATGNLVLSADFGTGPATSAWQGYNSPVVFTITNGTASTGAAATVTYTFPVPYLKAPLYCTATQVGGTNPQGTFSAGTPTATSVVFTYSLTPTANATEFVQAVCYVAQ